MCRKLHELAPEVTATIQKYFEYFDIDGSQSMNSSDELFKLTQRASMQLNLTIGALPTVHCECINAAAFVCHFIHT